MKANIEYRREVYRKIAGGQEELCGEYFKLRGEIKNLNIWNEVLQNANFDYCHCSFQLDRSLSCPHLRYQQQQCMVLLF